MPSIDLLITVRKKTIRLKYFTEKNKAFVVNRLRPQFATISTLGFGILSLNKIWSASVICYSCRVLGLSPLTHDAPYGPLCEVRMTSTTKPEVQSALVSLPEQDRAMAMGNMHQN